MKLVKKIGKWLLYSLIVVFVLIIAGSHIMDSMMYYSDEDVIQMFLEHEASGAVEYINCEGVDMRVIRSTTGQRGRCIIFSHGAPGSWDAFKGFLTDSRLLETADLVSYDRPGYGNSSDGQSYPDIEFQADCLIDIFLSRAYEEVYLVGHSFGGPIIMEVALKVRQEVNGVILLAPVVDPETEKFFPGGKLAYWPWSRWLWPTGFQVSADEKYTHVEELRSLEEKMDQYKT
ncbi:MAG: alpha/beta hydrolase, partial [Saprospiraceae bacterium]|nr:alpha/beta hydrolase [Saprospiraceae bacterium]